MIKQVWVAVHPDDPKQIEIEADQPNDYDYWFESVNNSDTFTPAEYKPAMLVMED